MISSVAPKDAWAQPKRTSVFGALSWLAVLPAKSAVLLIRVYQQFFSPDHSFWARAMNRPPYCKHIPSCSEYASEAFEKKGFLLGLMKTVWRILRCNPWNKGGYDPVDRVNQK